MTPQFRGLWIPADIVTLMNQRIISHTEMMLLSVIDSFVQSNGNGCFASNAYLAEKIGSTPRYVERTKTRLFKLGLLIKTKKKRPNDKRHRMIETCWSRQVNFETITPPSGGQITPPGDGVPNYPTGNCSYKGRNPSDKSGRVAHKEKSSSDGNTAMPFPGFEISSKKDKKLSQFDKDRAGMLHSTILKLGKNRTKWNKTNWAHEIRKLRQSIDGDKDRIRAAMDFFVLNHGKGKLPQNMEQSVISARLFRRHFDWIEDIMKKETSSSKVKPSLASIAIIRRLQRMTWPKGSDKQLTEVVQLSLEAVIDYRKRLRAFIKEAEATKKGGNSLSWLAKAVHNLEQSEGVVERHLLRVHKQIREWAEWNGNLRHYIWQGRSPDNVKNVKTVAREYGLNEGTCDRLMEAIYK